MYTEKFPMLRLVTTTLSFIFAADAVSLSMAALPLSSLPENHNHFPSSYADDASVHRQPHRDRQLTKQQHDLWHSRYSAIRSDNDNNNNNQSRNLQQPRIFGGRDAKTGQYAYYVHAIDEELCGGSLIAPDIVLSAAHCKKAYTGKSVTVGSTDLLSNDKNAEILDIDFLFPHPDYTPGPESNDIMLIKLKESAKQATLVTLNTDMDEPVTDQAVVVIGFGITDWGGSVSETLQEVEVQTLTWRDCGKLLPDIQEFHVCAGLPQGGKDSCAGDSGGPLVDASNKNLQYGLISFGYGCGEPNAPGVYTSVAYYDEWISEFVCAESDDPPEQFGCRGGQTGGNNDGGEEEENATSLPTTPPSTFAPTRSPTFAPTPAPTTSAPVTPMPSFEPTMIASDTPTSVPSLRPSISWQPSHMPSAMPSNIPSDIPSDVPSDVPTSVPTAEKEVAEETPVNNKEEGLETQQEETVLVQERDEENTRVPLASYTTGSATADASRMSSKATMTVVTFLLGFVGIMMQ